MLRMEIITLPFSVEGWRIPLDKNLNASLFLRKFIKIRPVHLGPN